MKKVIYLYWRKILLVQLSYEEGTYVQHIMLENLKIALQDGCPIDLLFTVQVEKIIRTTYLPVIFDNFNFSNSRVDLVDFYNINPSDSVFDKLYKVSLQSTSISHDEFWISANGNEI